MQHLPALPDDQLDAQGIALLPVFLDEAESLLPRIADALSSWQQTPADNDAARPLLRLLHTFKGSARMAGLGRIGERIHAFETGVQGGAPASGLHVLQADISARVARLADAGTPPVASAPEPAAPNPTAAAAEGFALTHNRIGAELRNIQESLMELGGDIVRMRKHLRELGTLSEHLVHTLANGTQPDPALLERLQQKCGYMGEGLDDVQAIQQALREALDDASSALEEQAAHCQALQPQLRPPQAQPLLHTRLLGSLQRTADTLGKAVHLVLEGEGFASATGLPARLLPAVEQLLNNAAVHGIETAERRLAAGKSAAGEIRLDLNRVGNEWCLICRDDGAGLDSAAIQSAARARGMLAGEGKPDAAALRELIFSPGFSTLPQAHAFAGHGIGLDMVRQDIEAIGGRLEVDSSPGRGTRFTLHWPA